MRRGFEADGGFVEADCDDLASFRQVDGALHGVTPLMGVRIEGGWSSSG
jgi:hypothetical protein